MSIFSSSFIHLSLTSNNCLLIVALDPKPFIQTFEAAVDRLIAVRKDVQARTEQMEKSVRVAEREYSKKMAELNRGFEVCSFGLPLATRPNSIWPTHCRRSATHSQGWRLR